MEHPMKHVILLAGLTFLLGTSAALAAPEEAMTKAGCFACHAKDKKVVGPALKEIAAKYKGQDVVAKLIDKVRKGGAGSFGPVPMSPNTPDKINDADLKDAVAWILQQG
jgi:cytochrome c